MSNILKLCPTYFSRGGEKFSRGASLPCTPSGYGHERWTGRSCIADTSNHFAKSWHHASDSWSGYWLGLGKQRCEQPPWPWSIQQQSTALLSGAAVLIPASLILWSTTPCELWLDPCVLYQRTISYPRRYPTCSPRRYPILAVNNLLSFLCKGATLSLARVPWSQDICSTHRSSVHRVGMYGTTQIETPICIHRTTH